MGVGMLVYDRGNCTYTLGAFLEAKISDVPVMTFQGKGEGGREGYLHIGRLSGGQDQ